MITPWINRIHYCILQIVMIVFELVTLFGVVRNIFGFGVLNGLLMWFGGRIVVRFFFEIVFVRLKISENTS